MKRAGYTIWKERTEATYPNWLFSTNPGEEGVLQDPGIDGKIKNILSIKGTGAKA
jgi:hypothetical protein